MPGHYKKYQKNDIRVSHDIVTKIHTAPSSTFTELIACRESASDDKFQTRARKVITGFKPTIVEYEQGYAYSALSTIMAELTGDVRTVFSSHNVEWRMKEQIALSEGASSDEISALVEEIRTLEQDLIRHSDVVICVSDADRTEYERLNDDKKRAIIVIPNGINRLKPSESGKRHWDDYKKKNHIKKLILFVASAHPPNLHGFRSLIDGVGFLPFSHRIVVAGSLSDMLKALVRKPSNIQEAIMKNRVMFAGRLSEESLEGLIAEADVIILPILEGGGSNLKTAEAIIADKPVVATSHAFRSYETFLDVLPNLHIADSAVDFQAAIERAITAPKVRRSAKAARLAESVLWENCLAPLKDIISKVRVESSEV
jgi:glycosyltransferase involved in cell wall biosynthesis